MPLIYSYKILVKASTKQVYKNFLEPPSHEKLNNYLMQKSSSENLVVKMLMYLPIVRSSYQSCSIKKAALKNFTIFIGKHLCWSAHRETQENTCNLIKKKLQNRCFPMNIAKFLGTPILKNICERLFLQCRPKQFLGLRGKHFVIKKHSMRGGTCAKCGHKKRIS